MIESPVTGCVKFNVDVAAKEGVVGCETILRSKEGVMRAILAGPVEGSGTDFTELIAVKITLHVFFEAKWTCNVFLIVESDFMLVLHWINDAAQRLWRWWSVLLEIDALA
ncbi:hypothetical protein V6N11_031258 [Hibiscus sabdariffa]|uniref:RNase H type-1 domain-containing protein n=1 Tax=Hibiscus sabdariffa TaxID=183260 RepID=A0ABR2SXX0_9ROSI